MKAAQFWGLVLKTNGCWLWRGTRTREGYGLSKMGGRRVAAHRKAWALTNGALPDDVVLRHSVCDNPPCVRPDHMLPGTQSENIAEMYAKGRRPTGLATGSRGERHHNARLNASDVIDIRSLRAFGATVANLSAAYSVGHSQIRRILSGEQWH